MTGAEVGDWLVGVPVAATEVTPYVDKAVPSEEVVEVLERVEAKVVAVVVAVVVVTVYWTAVSSNDRRRRLVTATMVGVRYDNESDGDGDW